MIKVGLPIAGMVGGTVAAEGNPMGGMAGGGVGTALSNAYGSTGGLSSLMDHHKKSSPAPAAPAPQADPSTMMSQPDYSQYQSYYGQQQPSYSQPQPSYGYGQPQSYYGYGMPSYAHGGVVPHGLHAIGQNLAHYGRHGDTMLAHINPEEAHILKMMGGSGTINPHTGLPEFGWLSDVWHAVSEPFKQIIKPVKKFVGPVLGSGGGAILGNMLLPGIGGILGSTLGGAAGGSFGHPNQRMGPLGGGMMGVALPTVAGGLGSLASHAGATGLGGALSSYGSMAGLSNALPYLGMGGAANAAGSMPFSTHAPTHLAHTLASRGGGGGLLSSLGNLFGGGGGGGMGGMSSLLGPALLGATALGTMNRKVKYEYPKGTSLQEELSRNGLPGMDEENEYDVDIPDRHYQSHPSSHSPESEWQFYDQVNPFTNMKVTKRKKKKFSDGGYLNYGGGGQDDRVNINVSGGETIIPADVTSALGDGNSVEGGKKLMKMCEKVRKHKGYTKFPPKAKMIESYMH